MRKRIALLLLMALALTVVLTACAQTAETKIIPRWDAEESYVYNVSLADFNTSEGATYPFNWHGSQDNPYYKDFMISAGESFGNLDEIRPTAVTGTYRLTINRSSDGYDTVEGVQELATTYTMKNGEIVISENVTMPIEEALLQLGEKSADSITFNSVIKTSVTFTHDAKQAPVSSSTEVHGFYVGLAHREISNYKVSTVYNYEGKRPVAEITLTFNGETTEITDTLKGYSQGSFIDSNQLFTYARSFDKSAGSFASSTSVAVYNPFNQTKQNASFAFNAAANALLTNGAEELYAKVPTLGIVVGGMPFMLMESAPNFKDKLPDRFDAVGNGPDSAFFGEHPYAKHTPLRFRVGYISFELATYDATLWETLIATTLPTE